MDKIKTVENFLLLTRWARKHDTCPLSEKELNDMEAYMNTIKFFGPSAVQ